MGVDLHANVDLEWMEQEQPVDHAIPMPAPTSTDGEVMAMTDRDDSPSHGKPATRSSTVTNQETRGRGLVGNDRPQPSATPSSSSQLPTATRHRTDGAPSPRCREQRLTHGGRKSSLTFELPMRRGTWTIHWNLPDQPPLQSHLPSR
jgi:hypothetical protein